MKSESLKQAVSEGQPHRHLHDHQSRRTVRIETKNPGKENEEQRTTCYLYDGWNLLAELDSPLSPPPSVPPSQDPSPAPSVSPSREKSPVRFFTWGLDLSGGLQGAGGVGGLLAVSEGESHRFPVYDANGNVSQLVDESGAITAAYTYDPFGNVTEMAGLQAEENPWRFSTKPVDAGTGWLYYGFRYYNPETGRWPSRDPIEEAGGWNLYGFVGNDVFGAIDYLGRAPSPVVQFTVALMNGQWASALHIINTYGAAMGMSAPMMTRLVRAISAVEKISHRPALTQANRAWHVIQPKHLWCRLHSLVPNTTSNALTNYGRVQSSIDKAWSSRTIQIANGTTGLVTKVARISGEEVVVMGRVVDRAKGIVEIVNAYVVRN